LVTKAQYSKKVMDLFKKPKNMGKIKDADGVGTVGNPVCGDLMTMYIKIGEKAGKKIITDVKVETFGCVAAIATSSIMTEMIKGKTLEQAEKVSNAAVAEALGGLPPVKMHCSVLAADAFKAALKDYKKKKGLLSKEEKKEEVEKEHDHNVCPACGHETKEKDKFCSYCGHGLKAG